MRSAFLVTSKARKSFFHEVAVPILSGRHVGVNQPFRVNADDFSRDLMVLHCTVAVSYKPELVMISVHHLF